jgi:hypothetical protein
MAPRGARPADGEGREVDEAVTRRHEQRDGADPVDVRLQQRRERVLDRGGEADDEQRLGADEGRLAAQERAEDRPGGGAEHELAGRLVRVEGAEGVGEEDDADPGGDGGREAQVTIAERGHGPRVPRRVRRPRPARLVQPRAYATCMIAARLSTAAYATCMIAPRVETLAAIMHVA